MLLYGHTKLPEIPRDTKFQFYVRTRHHVDNFFINNGSTYTFQKNCASSNIPFEIVRKQCAHTIIKNFQKLKNGIEKIQKEYEDSVKIPSEQQHTKVVDFSTDIDKHLNYSSIQKAVEYCKDKEVAIPTDTLIWLEHFFPKPENYSEEKRAEEPFPADATKLDESQQEVFDSAKKKADDNNHDTLSKKIDELVTKKKDTRLVDKVIPLMNDYINGNMSPSDLEVYLNELSQGGGSRSVCRNKRKTKKKIKNKYYKCSKKHHHHHRRTKRHMKRHRKTKRHTKRY
jgi:hypothetical protein